MFLFSWSLDFGSFLLRILLNTLTQLLGLSPHWSMNPKSNMFQVSPIVYFLFPLRCVADLLRSTFFFYNGTYSFYCLPSCASALLVSFPILMSTFTQLPSLLPSTFSLLLSPTDSASECLCFSLTHSYLSRPPSYFCVGPVGFYPYSPGFFFFLQ